MESKHIVKDFFKDKNGKVAVWQMPNFPLTAWFVLIVAAHFVDHGHLKSGLQFLSSAFLLAWSYLEIVSGASNFRRLLGLAVLVDIVLTHLL